jgi:hypothetical protein
MLFLARWARRLSWKETAAAFRTSWEKVFDGGCKTFCVNVVFLHNKENDGDRQ